MICPKHRTGGLDGYQVEKKKKSKETEESSKTNYIITLLQYVKQSIKSEQSDQKHPTSKMVVF